MVEPVAVWIQMAAAITCGVLLLVGILVLAMVAYTVMRRNTDGRRQLEELEAENARLRREIARLKSGQDAADETGIQAP